MGIKFSTPDHFWQTRDSIITNIYEGDHPTKADVNDAYQQLEEHVPTAKIIDCLVHEYGGHRWTRRWCFITHRNLAGLITRMLLF